MGINVIKVNNSDTNYTHSIFDISEYNNGATYANLSAALIAVPQDKQQGGMTVRFILTNINEYVQFRLLDDDWNNNTTHWSFYNNNISVKHPEYVYIITDNNNKIILGIKFDGTIYYGAGVPHQVIEYIQDKIDVDVHQLLEEKVDKEDGKELIPSLFIELINCSEFSIAELDDSEKLLFGLRKDGSWYLPTLKIEDIRTHWFGKSWHAYGTSLTNTNREGKYAKYVLKLSGLILHNHGISGGSIMHDGLSIKGAVFDDTDGKITADLVTLECWANDGSAVFGEITDISNTTFLGNLAQCIMHLQEVTRATIVIMISTMPVCAYRNPSSRILPTQVYNGGLSVEMADKMRQLCDLYGVYFINPNRALGNYRGGDKYIKDNIHHTELGGLVYARYIWSQLRNLPMFDTEINI